VPELETLQSAYEWMGGLGAEALAGVNPGSDLTKPPKRRAAK